MKKKFITTWMTVGVILCLLNTAHADSSKRYQVSINTITQVITSTTVLLITPVSQQKQTVAKTKLAASASQEDEK